MARVQAIKAPVCLDRYIRKKLERFQDAGFMQLAYLFLKTYISNANSSLNNPGSWFRGHTGYSIIKLKLVRYCRREV